MFIKAISLSTLLLASASMVIAAPGYDSDNNISDHYTHLKAVESEFTYHARVNQQRFVGFDENISTKHTTDLRLKEFGRTGGYVFYSDFVADGVGSHYRNHR